MKKLLIMRNILIILCVSYFQSLLPQGMVLSRVILSSDSNLNYLEYWPLAAKAWHELIDIKPTLIFIGENDILFDENIGEVIRFQPIPGLPTSFQAQIIRILIAALFPEEICIISDIDMLPVSKEYFCDSIRSIDENNFVIYREFFTAKNHENEIPICYIAAKGSTFQDIFKVKTIDDIKNKIIHWGNHEYKKFGWATDQKVLFNHLTQWEAYHTRCIYLGRDWIYRRLHTYDWPEGKEYLRNKFYVDISLPHEIPYSSNKTLIDEFLFELGLTI